MGLTIHYKLTTDLIRPKDVRQLVETMRQHALNMPFKEVGDVKLFEGEETGWNKDDPDHWLKIQATGHIENGGSIYTVPAQRIIAFSTWPGEGCEEANFGFCRYPSYFHATPGGKRLATKLKGWRWSSFCKTQYASDPKCGGVENFLRCHLCVVKMLDFIKATGLVSVEVIDESDYWDKRDLETLVKEVGEWNVQIAGLVNLIRTAAGTDGKSIEAPITNFPNFEHLEAKGLERLAELRRKLKKEGDENEQIDRPPGT
jgi:hypothetical protein